MEPIRLTGQIAVKSVYGRNGRFNVGRLEVPLGDFIVKDALLDLYEEGRYDGDFSIIRVYLWVKNFGSRMMIENRSVLSDMALSNGILLPQSDVQRLIPHEFDPVEEEATALPDPGQTVQTPSVAQVILHADVIDPLKDPTPFCVPSAAQAATAPQPGNITTEDERLFGSLFPLPEIVKLDTTVDRLLLRRQRDRLDKLGYRIDSRTQLFHLAA